MCRRGPAAAAVTAHTVVALAVLALPWYALGTYSATGWEGTAFARVALVAVVAAAALTLAGERLPALLTSLLAVALVAYRVALPPDFGFAFDGLAVPVERRVGCWVALAAATVAAALAASRALGRR